MQPVKPWQPGDPVGTGRVYLPTPDHRRQYVAECWRVNIEALAAHVIAGQSLSARQARLAKVPRRMRDAVKVRARELWEEKRK